MDEPVTTTTCAPGSVGLRDEEFADVVVSFGAGVTAYEAGTLLARDGAVYVPYHPGSDNPPRVVLTFRLPSRGQSTIKTRALVAGHVASNRLRVHGDSRVVDAAVMDALRVGTQGRITIEIYK